MSTYRATTPRLPTCRHQRIHQRPGWTRHESSYVGLGRMLSIAGTEWLTRALRVRGHLKAFWFRGITARISIGHEAGLLSLTGGTGKHHHLSMACVPLGIRKE